MIDRRTFLSLPVLAWTANGRRDPERVALPVRNGRRDPGSVALRVRPAVARRFQGRVSTPIDIAAIDRNRILRAATRYVGE